MNLGDIDRDVQMLARPPGPTPLNFLTTDIAHKIGVDHNIAMGRHQSPFISPFQSLGKGVTKKHDVLREYVPKFIYSFPKVVKDFVDMLKS